MTDHAHTIRRTAEEFAYEVSMLRNLPEDDLAPVSVDLLRAAAVALTESEAERQQAIDAWHSAQDLAKHLVDQRDQAIDERDALENDNGSLRLALAAEQHARIKHNGYLLNQRDDLSARYKQAIDALREIAERLHKPDLWPDQLIRAVEEMARAALVKLGEAE